MPAELTRLPMCTPQPAIASALNRDSMGHVFAGE